MEIIEFMLKFFLFCIFTIMIFATLVGGTYLAERLIIGKPLTPDELDELISKDVEEMLQREMERERRKGVIVEFIEDVNLENEKHDESLDFEEDFVVDVDIENEKYEESLDFEENSRFKENCWVEDVNVENEKYDDVHFEEHEHVKEIPSLKDVLLDNRAVLSDVKEADSNIFGSFEEELDYRKSIINDLERENDRLKRGHTKLRSDISRALIKVGTLDELYEKTLLDNDNLKSENNYLRSDVAKLKQELADKDVKYKLLEEKLNNATRVVDNKKRGIMNKDKLMMMMAMGGMNPNGNQNNGGMNPMMMAMMMGGKKDKGGFVENGKDMFDGIADKFMPSQIEGGMSFAGDVVIGGHGIKVVKDEEGTVDVKLIETCGLEIDMPLYVVPTPRANVQKGQIVILKGKDGKQRGVVVTEIGEGKLKGVDFANGNNRNINLLDNALGLDMLNVVFNPMGDAFAQSNGENAGLMGGMNPMMMMLMMGDE